MAKKDVLEIRVTFREDQEALYEYIKEHNSSSGFLKDLAYREMLRDENYIKSPSDNDSNNNSITINDIQRFISSCCIPQPVMNIQPYYIPQQPITNAPIEKNDNINKDQSKKGPDLNYSPNEINVLNEILKKKNKKEK